MHRLFTLLSIDNAILLYYNTVDLRYMKGKRFFAGNAAKTKKDKTTLLMTDGNIWKLLIVFSIPLILGNLLQQNV